MEHIVNSCKGVFIESVIRHRMARHYKRLEERLKCLNLNVVVWELISREWRYLEQDLIEDCKAVENGTYQPRK